MILGSVSVFVVLLVMTVRAKDGSGDCLGLSNHVNLGLNGSDLGELFDFEVSRALLEVVPVELQDSRTK